MSAASAASARRRTPGTALVRGCARPARPNAIRRRASSPRRPAWPQSERPAIEPGPAPPAELELHPPRPAWLDRAAPPPPSRRRRCGHPARWSSPIRGPAREPPALVGAEAARRRGILIHRLLQSLPGVAEERRGGGFARLSGTRELRRRGCGADLGGGRTRFSPIRRSLPLFGPDGRAEIDLVGRIATPGGDYAVSGRIDRLVRDAAGWRILDFKTDRAVPAGASAVDPAYVLQLAIYRRLIREIEPGARSARASSIPPVRSSRRYSRKGDGRGPGAAPGGLSGGSPRRSPSLIPPVRLPTFQATENPRIGGEIMTNAVSDASFDTDVLALGRAGRGRFLGGMVRPLQDDRARISRRSRRSSTAR